MLNKHKQIGFSLIEVLIALCLTTIVLLGMTVAQLQVMRTTNHAFYLNQAIEQLQAMANIIKTNHGDYAEFLSLWNKNNSALLPHGHGDVETNGAIYTINISWQIDRSSPQKITMDTTI